VKKWLGWGLALALTAVVAAIWVAAAVLGDTGEDEAVEALRRQVEAVSERLRAGAADGGLSDDEIYDATAGTAGAARRDQGVVTVDALVRGMSRTAFGQVQREGCYRFTVPATGDVTAAESSGCR
jgi:hypothetical protein